MSRIEQCLAETNESSRLQGHVTNVRRKGKPVVDGQGNIALAKRRPQTREDRVCSGSGLPYFDRDRVERFGDVSILGILSPRRLNQIEGLIGIAVGSHARRTGHDGIGSPAATPLCQCVASRLIIHEP